ncbi:MAG TPA: hypothetical protein VJJ52_02030 [Candidatus Nanoarchaeia archaeon]|nr:hypothetical protein [Candidatus Nanoarchaeia archaeon]
MRIEEVGGLKESEIDFLRILKRKHSGKRHWADDKIDYYVSDSI